MKLLVVRLGAMGDVLHALPAVADLHRGAPGAHLAWVVDPKWSALLEENPWVDEIIPFNRRRWQSIRAAATRLRGDEFERAVDFQGLIKSGLVLAYARARRRFGFASHELRERAAGLFYDVQVSTTGAHVVDRNRELARAAGGAPGAAEFPLPPGRPEGELPDEPFVLACPLAGWPAKQWPLHNYAALARLLRERLGMQLVLNGPPSSTSLLAGIPGARAHLSGLPGLIDATRRARAVLGLDSGPLHLAAALGKPGVALFGPTDPARNGPYGGDMTVLRDHAAVNSYRRSGTPHPSMHALSVEHVFSALSERIGRR